MIDMQYAILYSCIAPRVSQCYFCPMEIALFPLALTAFEREVVNLHIFEERYKQLIADCMENDTAFGLVPYFGEQTQDCGSMLRIQKIEKKYADGRLDVSTLCEGRFWIERMVNPWPGKLYAGANGELMPELETELDETTVAHLLQLINEFYSIIGADKMTRAKLGLNPSAIAGHKVGLDVELEYDMLLLNSEQERVFYMCEHLEGLIPILMKAEKTKEKIQMNGHFKRYDALDF